MTLTIDKVNYTNNYNINNNRKISNSKNNNIKIASAISSTVGVATAMCAITKKNPLQIVRTVNNPKKLLQGLKKIELNGMDVMKIATSSISGGFVAGSIIDPDNKKAKAKEGITQLIGNYIVPSAFVTGSIKLNKIINKNFNKMPQNRIVNFAFGILSLIAGVFAGNSISKEINAKVFKEDAYRPLQASDWGMQLDNVCLVTSIANPGTNLAKNVSKIIPIAHIIPGYLVGTKKEENNTNKNSQSIII